MEPNALYRFATPPFEAHKRDVFTKHGEDGIVEEILGRLGELRPNNLAIDCQAGAVRRSKTFNLLVNHGFRVHVVRPTIDEDRDEDRDEDLASAASEFPNLKVTDVDAIDRAAAVLACVDDIDSWDALGASPAVVISRIDPTIPPTADGDPSRGVPVFKSVVGACERKGYAMVAHAGSSAVLVRSDMVARLGIPGITTRDPARVFDWHAIEALG